MILLNVNGVCLDLGRRRGVRMDSDYPIQSAKEREATRKKQVESHIVFTTHTHLALMFYIMVKRPSLVCLLCVGWSDFPQSLLEEKHTFVGDKRK